MRRPSTLVRGVTMMWAIVQLATPALVGAADARAALESASQPAAHVEASTTERCPVVHAPDCGLCRYVSSSAAADACTPTVDWALDAARAGMPEWSSAARGAASALPWGRAPPLV